MLHEVHGVETTISGGPGDARLFLVRNVIVSFWALEALREAEIKNINYILLLGATYTKILGLDVSMDVVVSMQVLNSFYHLLT